MRRARPASRVRRTTIANAATCTTSLRMPHRRQRMPRFTSSPTITATPEHKRYYEVRGDALKDPESNHTDDAVYRSCEQIQRQVDSGAQQRMLALDGRAHRRVRRIKDRRT